MPSGKIFCSWRSLVAHLTAGYSTQLMACNRRQPWVHSFPCYCYRAGKSIAADGSSGCKCPQAILVKLREFPYHKVHSRPSTSCCIGRARRSTSTASWRTSANAAAATAAATNAANATVAATATSYEHISLSSDSNSGCSATTTSDARRPTTATSGATGTSKCSPPWVSFRIVISRVHEVCPYVDR